MTLEEAEEQGECTCSCHYKSLNMHGAFILHFMPCCHRTGEPYIEDK